MASSSSVLLRLVSRKGLAASSSSSYHCNLGKWTARSVPSYWFNRRCLTTAAAAAPMLMLPPEFEGRAKSYKFYSLADDKVRTLGPIPRDLIRLKCRGSSRGWLALLSPHTEDFFLYNPITHRRIKLPSIDDLPRTSNYDSKDISKFILTCSPDEDEENCRVVISAGDINPLAVCCPGRSKKWTLLRGARSKYHDCVYSAGQKLLFGLTVYGELETWDLGDPSSPRLIDTVGIRLRGYYNLKYLGSYFDLSTPTRSLPNEYLVAANQDDLLLVIQYLKLYVTPDGSCFEGSDESKPDDCHRMTIGFEVFKYDPEKGRFDDDRCSSLGGLALFLGRMSDSVAIPEANRFPGLKANSVYFTDMFTEELCGYLDDREENCTGFDIGIFSCEDGTVSPCYYPCDARSLRKILPAPMWFFPSHPI